MLGHAEGRPPGGGRGQVSRIPLCSGLAGRHASAPGCSSVCLFPLIQGPPAPHSQSLCQSQLRAQAKVVSFDFPSCDEVHVLRGFALSCGLHLRRQVAYLSSQLSEVVSLESFVGFFMISRPHLGKARARVSGWGAPGEADSEMEICMGGGLLGRGHEGKRRKQPEQVGCSTTEV